MHLLGITAAGRKQRDGACTPQHRRARTLRAIVRSACAAVLATTLVALGGCSENDAVGKTTNPSGSQSQTSGRPTSGRSLRSPRSTKRRPAAKTV